LCTVLAILTALAVLAVAQGGQTFGDLGLDSREKLKFGGSHVCEPSVDLREPSFDLRFGEFAQPRIFAALVRDDLAEHPFERFRRRRRGGVARIDWPRQVCFGH
jgi:hypothetical protein